MIRSRGTLLIVTLLISALCGLLSGFIDGSAASTGVHTSYLWHMHQPIYWPDNSTWTPGRYETAYETIALGHSESDVFSIFNVDDRVAAYQWSPRDAVNSMLDLPEAGAQVSFAGALIENIKSLGDAGWNGGRYASNWSANFREARGWTTSGGKRRMDMVVVGHHHGINALMDENAVRKELACAKAIYDTAWGDNDYSKGFFPAEMCFSERLIPALVEAGLEWVIVPDVHIARACANYPYAANEDNCDPPNAADKINPAQNDYTSHYISRGVTLKVPYPFGFTPHQAEAVDPLTGEVSQIVVIPAANAMGWEEGSGMFGTGSIDAMASSNNPNQPMLVLFAHDGDNHWAGGYSYYYESVPQFSHQAASAGYTPTVVAQYLQDHPVPADDIVHIEDGGWVNADGDFGSPQYINWNWPLVDPSGAFDIPSGWAEDERNWAVLTAAQNRVETAEQILGGVDPEKIVNPTGANNAERAWHHLLAGYESGYMYYGSSIDMEIKATLACNNAVTAADAVIAGGSDGTAPTIWLPQRLPWNPGGSGGGALWGYPGGAGAPMSSDFHIWTFAYDVSGLARIELMIREDLDGWNDPESHDNETFAGGAETGAWTALPMTYRDFPIGEPWDIPGIDFTVLPDYIADEYWLQLTGYAETLLDYYVEAEDNLGNIKRTPIQHVYVGEDASGGYVMDGSLDDGVALLASGGGLSLWGAREDNILYLATEGIGATADLDHFLMVLTDTSSVVNAPWAKSGSVREWDYFLAAEDGNGWIGWFDAAQSVQSGVSYGLAQGAVLEGTLNLDALYPGGIPETFWLAALGYETQDGGALIAQAPAGNGNGNVEGVEYCELAPASEVDDPAQQLFNGLSLSPHPTPFSSHLTLRLELPQAQNVQIDIFNIAGQRVAQIYDGPAATGSRDLSWNGRKSDGTACPNGIYWIKASGETGSVSARCVLMR